MYRCGNDGNVRKLVPTTPPWRALERREIVPQKIVDVRIGLAVKIGLHHAGHLLEEAMAVAVGGVGAVLALDPPDAASTSGSM